MASKRTIKKAVKDVVYDIMDECDYVVVSGGTKSKEANDLMDETVAFYEDSMTKINAAKSKKEFAVLRPELESQAQEFRNKINAIS